MVRARFLARTTQNQRRAHRPIQFGTPLRGLLTVGRFPHAGTAKPMKTAPGVGEPAGTQEAEGVPTEPAGGPDANEEAQQSDMVRIILPFHLRNLAHVGHEVTVDVEGPITQRSVLDALEARYPMLRGTIRDHDTFQRRPFLRFFACEQDLSHEPPDVPLPEPVASGKEPFIIIGAIAGG